MGTLIQHSFSSTTAVVAWMIALSSYAAAELPAIGRAPSALRAEVLQPNGEYAESELVAESQEKPVVYLLIPATRWDRPIARFLKTLDEKLPGSSAKAEVRAVWLTADAAATREYLQRVAQSLQLQRTSLALVADEAGPAGWQVAGGVQLAVVVAYHGKVVAATELGSANETDVPPVVEAVAKALDE